MWGAAIGGASSIIGNWIGSRQNRKNVHDTNKANREMAEYSFGQNRKMAEYSYDKNLEQWHRQNKYNNPKAQMSRFKDAGLNPHLIYGQGSPGNATGSPQHSPAKHTPAKQDYTGRTNPVAMSLLDVAQARLLNAQTEQIKKQTDLTGAQTDNTKSTTQGINLDNLLKEGNLPTTLATAKQTLKNATQQEKLIILDQTAREIANKIETIKSDYWKGNVNPNDSTLMRNLGQVINAMGLTPDKLAEHLKNLPKTTFQDIMNFFYPKQSGILNKLWNKHIAEP